jgi:2'-5' RNA ligase
VYYALVFYPQLNPGLAEAIHEIRRKHDPTVGWSQPHITVVFPVLDTIGELELISHIEQVLVDWDPFRIKFGGFYKSSDHWLFLTVTEGEVKIKSLYRSLYTGLLEEYRRDDIEFVPHLGLGLFVKKGARYDWNHPQETDFDRLKYEEALQQTNALPLGSSCVLEKLHLVEIPEEILEWATGKRARIPKGSKSTEVREFHLGGRTT